MRGFTTVRDIGGNAFAVKTIDAGKFPGPRMLVAGASYESNRGHMDVYPYTDVPRNPSAPLPYLERNGMLAIADGVPDVTRKAREIIRTGASQIKIAGGGGVGSIYDPVDVTQYSLEEMQAIVGVREELEHLCRCTYLYGQSHPEGDQGRGQDYRTRQSRSWKTRPSR